MCHDRSMESTEAGTGLPHGIGASATRVLTAAGYTELSQLADVPEEELKALHGMARRLCEYSARPWRSAASA